MSEIPVTIPYMDENEINEVAAVIKSGWVAQGAKVAEFENMVCAFENVKHGIAATSCTSALHLALVALGIGAGHDVIIPSFTFVATPNAVVYTGATPVFVDVAIDTYNISVEALEKTITKEYYYSDNKWLKKDTNNELKALIAVSLFGLCADLPKLNQIAEKYGLSVIQDSACAFGAKINGKMEASFGNITCLSFHPRKSITTGEGGMVLTDDDKISDMVRRHRSHGACISEVDRHKKGGYLLPEYNELGYNYRMTDIQAAVGVAQMGKMDFITNTRRMKADLYNNMIRDMRIDFLRPPFIPKGYFSTYQSYVCVLDYAKLGFSDIEKASEFRNELMQRLEEKGIATRVGTHATHMLGYYKDKFGFKKEDFPNSYELDRLSITLPLYVQMSDDVQERVLTMLLKLKKEIFAENNDF